MKTTLFAVKARIVGLFRPTTDSILADLQRTRDKLAKHEDQLYSHAYDLEESITVLEQERLDTLDEARRASRVFGRINELVA